MREFKAVLQIHDILVWIRIRGSMPLTNGPDPAIFVIDLQEANKKLISTKVFLLITFFEGTVHLHNFSKIKSQNEVTKQ